MATSADPHRESTPPVRPEDPPRAGPILAFWMILVVGLELAIWISGARPTGLREAVERGAARVETQGVGEVGDEVVRKAIALQHETLPFWGTIAALGDFAFEPLSLALRAAIVATIFAGLALLRGRPVAFSRGFAACAAAQAFWVLGLAVKASLVIALRRPEIETSAALLLAPGTYAGTTWLAARQLDVFAMLGWGVMAVGGWRRGQVGVVAAILVCVLLFLAEAVVRLEFGLLVEAGMRLSLLPDV